jgi:hypothetical protein
MKKQLVLVGAVLSLLSQAAMAYAEEWHWEAYGTGSYSGQVNLRDDQGSALNYQRYSSGMNPQLFGMTSVQSPMVVVAGGNDITIDLVRAGTAVPKPTCTAPETPKIYVTASTVCDSGVGSNIGGYHTWAEDSGTDFIPRLAVWVQGLNWRQINNNPCGIVQVQTMCK